MPMSLALIAGGLALLVLAANLLVDGSCAIARRLGLSDRVIGLTVVAVGTAMPELVVGITSAVSGHADMAYGNVVGSCMANLLLILGLSAVLSPLALGRRTLAVEVPASVGAVALLALASNAGGRLDAVGGAVLLAAFLAFMGWTVAAELRGRAGDAERGAAAERGFGPATAEKDAGGAGAAETPGDGAGALARLSERHAVVALALVAVGVALLKVGAELVVTHASLVAAQLGVGERVVGLTVVAVGTCLPELVTSLVAAARGNAELAVGNVVGSNITNALLVMGLPALFAPLPYDPAYNLDLALLALCSAALVAAGLLGRRGEMGRAGGAAFVAGYVAYVALAVLAV